MKYQPLFLSFKQSRKAYNLIDFLIKDMESDIWYYSKWNGIPDCRVSKSWIDNELQGSYKKIKFSFWPPTKMEILARELNNMLKIEDMKIFRKIVFDDHHEMIKWVNNNIATVQIVQIIRTYHNYEYELFYYELPQ